MGTRSVVGQAQVVRDVEAVGTQVSRGLQVAERIGQLLEDDALATRMSREALAWSKNFDWDVAAREMLETLEAAR